MSFFILILCNHFVLAGSRSECGLSSIGTISGSTSGCVGQTITFTFNGGKCLYSGCTLQRQIKVFSGSTLIYTSTASTSTSHSFTPSSSGTYTVYGYVKASNYNPWCTTNSVCFSTTGPATPTGACGSVTACTGESFTLSATPASGTTLKWYKGTTLIGSGNSISYSESSAGSYTYKAYSYNTSTGCISSNGLSVSATITAGATNLVITAASSGNIGQSITVSGSATGTGLTYSWNFGSGASPATGTGAGPFSITYNSIGSKTLTLTVTNCYGCVATITKTILVCPNAIINCPTSSCSATNTQFTATDAGTNATYAWNFGSGSTPATASGKGPHNVSYSSSGSKTVTLTVGNSTNSNCSDVDTKTINISNKPSGLAISSLSTVLVNESLSVSGSASGTGNTFNWNFGSGATPSNAVQGPVVLQNAWTNYTTTYSTGSGSYSFTNTSGNNRVLILTVGMEHGSELNLTGVTYGGKSLTQAVEKSVVTAAPSYGRVEIWYLKEADLAAAGTGSKTFAFTWSGTPDYVFYSAAVFSNVNQTTPIGNTGVNEGCTNPMSISSSLSVDANDLVVSAGICGNEGTYSSSGYTEGTDIVNSATATFASFYKLITSTGTETPSITFSSTVNRQGIAALVLNGLSGGNLNVTYSTVGPKIISLIVSNETGCSDTIYKTINVCGKAVISCPTTNCTNTVTQFSADDMGGNSVYTWNFGSGATPATATGKGPHNVSYSTTGSKSITLTVTNSDMSICNNVATKTLVINETPTAVISGPTSGNLNTNYTFTTPSVSGATYTWSVPTDGSIVSGAGTNSIVIKWPSIGTKTISVSVSKNGCTATDNHTIVFENCPVAIINSVSDICKSAAQIFSTVNQGTGVTYAWNFGSGASPATASTIGPHSVMYSTTGSKTATLTVSKTGCTTKSTSVSFVVNATLGTVSITPPPFNIFEDTSLTYSATQIAGATYTWSATGGATITGTGNVVQILFPTAGTQTITVVATKDGCSTTATLCITVKTPVCNGVKLNHTQVPLKTSMKNYTFTDVLTGNWVKLKKPTYTDDSFHTSRKFQRNKDTAISWQEICGTTSKSTIKFNRSASDLKFTIRDLDKSTSGQEIITVSAYLKGSLINTSGISATFNSSNIDDFNNTGTAVSFKGLTTATNSATTNDIALQFTSKVDSVALVLSNSYSPASGSTSTTSSDGKYKIDLIDPGTNTSTNQYTWTWKFTNINPGSTSPAISHWDVVFPSCALTSGILNDIVSVQYSYNGTSWSTLSGCNYDYDYDPSMTCDIVKALKIDKGMGSGNVIYYRIVLDRVYDVDYSAISFYKAGKSCGQMSFAGIGCTAVGCISDVGLSKMSFCITEPLPVTWLNINALKNKNGGINVNWATATEINNDYFIVEKSIDNRIFNEIGQMKGAGNKSTISKYTLEDKNPVSGTQYYRVKQVDYNGEFAYSAVVSINTFKLLNNVTMNPNPASSNVTLTWDAGIREQLTLQITDLSGVVILSEPLSNNNNVHYLNTQKINNGLYLVNILSSTDMVYRSRIVIAR